MRPFLQFRGYLTSAPYNPFLQINPDNRLILRSFLLHTSPFLPLVKPIDQVCRVASIALLVH